MSNIDRLPPHSPEAEQGVIGSVLIDPSFSMPICIEKLKHGAETFYDLRHQTIYGTFIELFEDGVPIDTINVGERLKLWDKLEQVGGWAYLTALPDAVASAQNIESHIGLIVEKFALRRMVQVCTDVVGKIYDNTTAPRTLLDEAAREVLRASETQEITESKSIRELVRDAINNIESYHMHGGDPSGILTGFYDFDKMACGLHQGEMIVIAGRPSTGKTSLAMNIAEFVALDKQLPVGVFSLEMTAASLVERMICSRARVNIRNVKEGFLAERDFPKITGAAGKLQSAPLYIDDTGGLSILQLRSKARRWVQQYGIKLFIIDYLQLLNASGVRKSFDNRQQEVSEISSGIKNLAKELQVPVIALSQMNREFEREKNRKPRMSDLRESGSLEQDADLVALLYKAQRDDDEDAGGVQEDTIPVNLLIAKQRSGPTGDVPLIFIKQYTRFESTARVQDE